MHCERVHIHITIHDNAFLLHLVLKFHYNAAEAKILKHVKKKKKRTLNSGMVLSLFLL